MFQAIRGPKDFWAGVVFIVIGATSLVLSSDYAMGSAGSMGPAYFPTILGGMLVLLGVASVLRSLVRSGQPIGRFAIRECALVLAATIVFGLLVRSAGLAIGTILVVVISGFASVKFKLAPFLALGLGLAVFGVLVFVYLLGLPMPMFGTWFGY